METDLNYARRLYLFSCVWIKTQMKPFTIEDLKKDWLKEGNLPPLQPSIYGTPFHRLSKNKLIFDTQRTVKSSSIKAHQRTIKVWISYEFRLRQQLNRTKDKTKTQIPLF